MFAFNRLFMPFLGLATRVVYIYICMEAGLPYACVNVSVRKHCLSKKITAHIMSAVMRELFDKWETIYGLSLISISTE